MLDVVTFNVPSIFLVKFQKKKAPMSFHELHVMLGW